MNDADLLTVITDYAGVQEGLLSALRSSWAVAGGRDAPDVTLPDHGAVRLDDETWTFRHYGPAIAFTSQDGCVVFAPHSLGLAHAVSAWGLVRYVETLGAAGEIDERTLQRRLEALAARGRLGHTTRPGVFTMQDSSAAG